MLGYRVHITVSIMITQHAHKRVVWYYSTKFWIQNSGSKQAPPLDDQFHDLILGKTR